MKKELSANVEGKDEERAWGKVRLKLRNNKYKDSIRKKKSTHKKEPDCPLDESK